MNKQQLINHSKHIQDIGEEYSDLFASQIESLKREHAIDSPKQLETALNDLAESDRLLNIGFVGRVKAGKSSLLNALFFNGKNVLPKAATPMTAALTTLTYGDRFAAEVEFFSEEDLQEIRALASRYEQQFKANLARYTGDIHKRFEHNGKPIDPEEIRKLAERQAMMEMRSAPSLAAAKEQVCLMQASTVDPATLGTNRKLAADNPSGLVEQLKSYVGAGGDFMSFTKIMHVYMPLESLRNIRVIDTPGTNDPVISREERTIALLKSCDVVFVISPAGQFLNEDDLELLNRITLREGVQELTLVASQVDSQLHDSEKRARLDDALLNVSNNLATQAKRNLEELKRRTPEGADVFQALLSSMQGGVLHSAGICLTLENELNTPTEQWGDEELTAWENLVESYPDYFGLNNPELSRVNLAKLANTSRIQERLAQVLSRKQTITEQKIIALLKRKSEGLNAFHKALSQLAQGQITLVATANIGDLRKQLGVLQIRREKLEYELKLTYQRCIELYRTQLRDQLTKGTQNALDISTDKISSAQDTVSYSKTIQKKGVCNWFADKLWDGGKETKTYQQNTVMTGLIHSSLKNFIFDMEELLREISAAAREKLDKQLSGELTPVVAKVLKEDCSSELIFRAIRDVVNQLDNTVFDLGIDLPRELRSRGTLKGQEAEDYIDQVNNFFGDLENTTKRKIHQYLEHLKQSIPNDVSGFFVDALTEQINALENQVNNSAQTLDRLENMQRKLEGVSYATA